MMDSTDMFKNTVVRGSSYIPKKWKVRINFRAKGEPSKHRSLGCVIVGSKRDARNKLGELKQSYSG